MITYHRDLVQGSEEWRAARCGLITASEMHLLVTPTLKAASNDKERSHIAELAAQRITKYVEPSYIGDEMLRGMEDEIEAQALYSKTYAPVETIGFITNDKFGFVIGYSPDAKLVRENAGIEIKSRRQKYQVETICAGLMPTEYVIQVQTGLMVSEWDWIDFISYSGGLPMVTLRIYPDAQVQDAILEAATKADGRINYKIETYDAILLHSDARLISTERKIEQSMYV